MQHNGERLVLSPIMTTEATKRSTLDMSLGDQENGVSVKKSLDKVDERHILEVAKSVDINTSEDNSSLDATYIMEFCIHAICIPKLQLSPGRLKQVGFPPDEVEEVIAHLESERKYKIENE